MLNIILALLNFILSILMFIGITQTEDKYTLILCFVIGSISFANMVITGGII